MYVPQIGDIVEIVPSDNENGHHFEVGATVTVTKKIDEDGDIRVQGVTMLEDFTGEQYIRPSDFKPVSRDGVFWDDNFKGFLLDSHKPDTDEVTGMPVARPEREVDELQQRKDNLNFAFSILNELNLLGKPDTFDYLARLVGYLEGRPPVVPKTYTADDSPFW